MSQIFNKWVLHRREGLTNLSFVDFAFKEGYSILDFDEVEE